MNAKQFTAALKRLELSHHSAAAVLGVGRNSVIRYAHGRTEVPVSVERLIDMLTRHGIPEEYAQ